MGRKLRNEKSDDKQDVLVRSTLAAIVRRATIDAERTIAFLQALFKDSEMPRLPGDVWLELGAVTRIYCWERDGILQSISTDLPDFKTALTDLTRRILRSAGKSKPPFEAALSKRVFVAAIGNLSIEVMNDVPIDVVLSAKVDDGLIDRLADFFWTNRHELRSLIKGENT